MSYDQNLTDCEAALADLAATVNVQGQKLTEANKLLDQTIEVLEGLLEEDPWGPMTVHYQRYWHDVIGCHYCGWNASRADRTHTDDCAYEKAKPLLDNLKAMNP